MRTTGVMAGAAIAVAAAVSSPGLRGRGTRAARRLDVAVVGAALCRPAPVDCHGAAAVPPCLGASLRQDHGALGSTGGGAAGRGLRRPRGRRSRAAYRAHRIYVVHHPAVRAVHHFGRYPPCRQHPWHAAGQCRTAAGRRHSRLHHRNDRRLDDPDPADPARQRRQAVQCPCRHLLHFPGVQHRRLADALGRSAAVRRLPARRRLFLDNDEPLARDAVRQRQWC